jgi:hypothetical protein
LPVDQPCSGKDFLAGTLNPAIASRISHQTLSNDYGRLRAIWKPEDIVPAQTFPKPDPTIGTALFAIRNPDLVGRVVFFAPTARRDARGAPGHQLE